MSESRWKRVKQVAWRWRGMAIAVPISAIGILGIRATGALQGMEWAAFDQYTHLSPQEAAEDRIAIVGLTETDLQKYGFPVSDQVLSEVLKKVRAQNPRAIGLDIYRDLPVEPGYKSLKQLFETTPNLIGIEKISGEINAGLVAPPPVLKELGQVAANDIVRDADGKVRRGLLYLEDRNGENRFGLGMATAMFYLQADGIELEQGQDQRLKLGKVKLAPFEANQGGYVRANEQGYQRIIHYRRSPKPFRIISVEQLLTGKVSPKFFQDRIVFIGSVAESLKDFVYTPHGVKFMQLGAPTPGVEVHAHIASQVISEVLGERSQIRTWHDGVEMLWIAGWAFAGGLTGVIPRLKSKRILKSSTIRWIGCVVLGSTSLIAITYSAFLASWWIPIVPAMFGFWSSAIVMVGFQARSAAQLRNTLGRYLTDEVVSSLLETPGGLKLVGERRKVTTLMADIRGFTSLSEQLSPEALVSLLNRFIATMTRTIQSYGGTVNDLTGDGIVVFFGAPIQREDDCERAVACAVAMQLAMMEVNQQSEALGLPQIEIGIGINTGEVVLGNIGSEKFAKYTGIGSHVNLAARIESFTTGQQILISESSYEEVAAIATSLSKIQTYVKGVHSSITLYEIGGIQGKYNLSLPEDMDVSILLKEPLLVRFRVLQGKSIQEIDYEGELIKLSAKGAEITSSYLPAGLSNLKLEIAGLQSDRAIYAKTLSQQEHSFLIGFTDVPPKIAEVFRHLRGDRRLRQ